MAATPAAMQSNVPGITHQALRIPSGSVTLKADLSLPAGASAAVLFAHGSGSGRLSPRNRFVAGYLTQIGVATVLADLLTEAEEEIDQRTRHLRFDIGLLAKRLIDITDWMEKQEVLGPMCVGYFGASTGAGAALMAAADRPGRVCAVVSRGGRPDLAGTALARVQAPTLLIVGGNDEPVIELNEQALTRLNCEKKLVVIPGATHLFEEYGALEEVARHASDWFCEHLVRPATRKPRAVG